MAAACGLPTLSARASFISLYPPSRAKNESRRRPTVFVLMTMPHACCHPGLLKSVACGPRLRIAHEFLRRKRPDGPSCLVLDVSFLDQRWTFSELPTRACNPHHLHHRSWRYSDDVKAMKSVPWSFSPSLRGPRLADAIHQALDRDE